MERNQGEDEKGKYEEIIYKFIPGRGLCEISSQDPEWKEEQKRTFLINQNRKSRVKK